MMMSYFAFDVDVTYIGDSDTDTAGRCKKADIICTTAEKLGA